MSSGKSCFVISAIGATGSTERKQSNLVLNYIIRPVAEKNSYSVTRGDESGHSGMVTVDTINSLFDADLVIADLSFLNPNVFYELGLRHSTKKPTIHIASVATALPFDNADHRAIFYDPTDWDSHEQARLKLHHHMQALEKGDVTNPVTIAQAHKNDARLTRTIAAVGSFLNQLEERLGQMTLPPPPGHVTRDEHMQITDQHRSDILQIVTAIRQRIDERELASLADQPPQVADVLRRLTTIEHIVKANHSLNVHPEPSTPQ